MPTEEIVRLRIAHVPEGRGTFTTLTVDENLRIAAYTRKDKAGVAAERERVFGYFPRLKERIQQQAGTLSGGEQQMLAIARALMLKPRLMLLDEPSFGLAPLIVVEIFRILRRINEEEKVSILLVEQNAALALDLATHAYVLETGTRRDVGPVRRREERRERAQVVSRLLRRTSSMEQFLQQLASGLANGAIYACVALALVMIYVSTDHLNFAQGEMAMFSTYISWQLMSVGPELLGRLHPDRGDLVRAGRADRARRSCDHCTMRRCCRSSWCSSACWRSATRWPARSGAT